jgi:hypothetical protein
MQPRRHGPDRDGARDRRTGEPQATLDGRRAGNDRPDVELKVARSRHGEVQRGAGGVRDVSDVVFRHVRTDRRWAARMEGPSSTAAVHVTRC